MVRIRLIFSPQAAHWWEQKSVRIPQGCSDVDRAGLLTVQNVNGAAAGTPRGRCRHTVSFDPNCR